MMAPVGEGDIEGYNITCPRMAPSSIFEPERLCRCPPWWISLRTGQGGGWNDSVGDTEGIRDLLGGVADCLRCHISPTLKLYNHFLLFT